MAVRLLRFRSSKRCYNDGVSVAVPTKQEMSEWRYVCCGFDQARDVINAVPLLRFRSSKR